MKHLGPFRLEAGETASHKFDMPNYVGSVRTMVVAAKEGAYGHAEKATAVRRPLMVLGTLPRVIGPGEKVKLPVNVSVMAQFWGCIRFGSRDHAAAPIRSATISGRSSK